MNSLYTLVSGRFNLKINKRFYSLSWSSVVSDLYTRSVYITVELNGEQEQAWQAQKKKRWTPFSPLGFSIYKITKGFLSCLN